MDDQRTEHQPWPVRALLLLFVGALLGLVFYLLIRDSGDSSTMWGNWTDNRARLSLATFVAIGGLLFAFTLERARWPWAVAFAAGGGAVLGLVFYWNGDPGGAGADQVWRFVSGLLAVAIAAPLFQTVRDEGRVRLPYPSVHAHSWTNVVLWFAAWTFVLVTWLLVLLLSELFRLIGIDLLRDALREDWFNWMLICGALGAAVGLLRDRDRVLGLLQRVVTTVLSFLAPILALGLVLFVLALPFTGLAPLWEQTRATTPILLSCMIGAVILANAVIGNSVEEEAQARPLRWSAMALVGVMLPLVVVAAVSTGLRIGQHGFTPSRLWAAVFILIATAYATLYLLALVLGRRRWSEQIRSHNILLALGVCGLALLLATPLLSFGAISTRDQLARLESGRIALEDFDWRAMRFDFGESGRSALERLAASTNADVRRQARRALAAGSRWDLRVPERERERRAERLNIRMLPAGPPVPAALRQVIADSFLCLDSRQYTVIHQPGSDTALLVLPPRFCRDEDLQAPPPGPDRLRMPDPCEMEVFALYEREGRWGVSRAPGDSAARRVRYQHIVQGLARGALEVRTVPRRQLFIGGEPVGEPFE